MLIKNYFSPILFAILFISCSQNFNNGDFKDISKSEDPESLEFWTSDTILKTNYPLVQLMDTLYQHVRSDSFPSESLNSEIQWMRKYRQQLISYYNSTRKSTDSISPLAKADSVISEARALWDIDSDYSTRGLIIKDNAEFARLMFEQFNEYERLLSICQTEAQKDLLYNEFAEWCKLERLFSHIYDNCVDLHFWGGRIAGPTKTSGCLGIWRSHIDLYRNEYIILASYEGGWKDTGTFLEPARELLMSCCKQALEEYYYPEDDERYKDIYKETKELMLDMPQLVDSWIKARKPWEDEMSSDFLHQTYSRNTSSVLIKLANILSSVQ